MFPLTHMVLGCGATWASQRLLGHLQGSATASETSGQAVDPIDYRLVVAGAILPDVVDKPLGIYLLRNQLRSGRIYGHTLLLSLGLVVAGSLLIGRWRHRLRSLGLGVGTHLLADDVVSTPRTLFWPLGGLRFPQDRSLEGWGWKMLRRYYSDPQTVTSEALSALVVLAVGGHLLRRRRLVSFLLSGRL